MEDQEFKEKENPHQDEFNEFFNEGYMLAKNNPESFDTILWEAREDSPRSRAIIWGRWMFEHEMKKDDPQNKEPKALSEIKAIRSKGKDTQRDFEMEW